MRRVLITLSCMLLTASIIVAGEVTLVKFDGEKREVTVKEGEKEMTYKIAEKVKVILVLDQDGKTKEGTLDVAAKILGNENFKGKKFEITTDKETITEIRLRARKGK